jgi:hypothetical protein
MNSEGYPFQGIGDVRKDRYLGSLTSHCKNLGNEIIVYTHIKNLEELEQLKSTHNLDNLTIKLLELTDMKLHKEINEVRERFFNEDLNGRGPEIMWGKFDVLEKELDGCDQIFWLDVGLQHAGIFPWMYCELYNDKEKYHDSVKNGSLPYWNDKQQTQYNFNLLFNKTLFDKIKEITTDKMFVITTPSPQTKYDKFIECGITDKMQDPYLIAGMFGGNKNKMKEFIDSFWIYANKVIENDFLVTEEAIMKLAFDNTSFENFIPFTFDVHATNEHDPYHFEIWEQSKNPFKPLYMIWHDMLNY